MASGADFHRHSDTTHLHLLAIPDELKLQILSNFDNYYNDPLNALTLMILRRTHKSFRRLIPNPWKKARPFAEHYILAERRYPYLFPFWCSCNSSGSDHSDHCPDPRFLCFPCYDCLKVIKWGYWNGVPHSKPVNKNFRNYEIAHTSAGDDAYWDTCWDTPGCKHARGRICDECWQGRLEIFYY